ncbi:MAG: hypothetical protein HDT28_04710 [Clostridiales bacterium]|nr:hypothetical protein [Clostridiales bacterium]
MKKVIKSLLLAASVATVCGGFGLVACSKEVPTFDAPTVTISESVLSWNAIDGAVEYTVKINDDETTTVTAVASPSFDVLTVTAKLVEGKNELSVKVNATDNFLASPYSEIVEYTYTPVDPGPGPGGDQDPPTTEKFTMSTVTLEGTTLKWTAVEGATNGYTVKINGDETTKVAGGGTSLDLESEDVVALLKLGNNNKLSVKVNAVGDKLASDYSNEVTYEYAPSNQQLIDTYLSIVENLEDVSVDSTDPATIKTNLDRAATQYANIVTAGLTEEAEVVAAKETYDAAFEIYDAAEKAYNAFAEALDTATAEVEKEESLSKLKTAKTAADTAKEGLNTLATSMITTEQSTAYAALEPTVTEWETAITAKKAEFDLLIKKIAYENAKTSNVNYALILSSCEDATDSLAGYVSAGVADELETIENYAADAKEAIRDQVEATIADELRTKLAAVNEAFETVTATRNATNVAALKTAYAEFEASYRKLEKLGTYGKRYFDTEVKLSSESDDLLTEAIDDMKKIVLATAVETVVQESVSCEGTGGAYITVSRSYVNCRGEALLLATAPVLTVDATNAEDTGAHIRSGFALTANADNVYVAQIVIDEVSKITTARYIITGGIDEESYISLNYELNMENPWFSNDNPPADDTVGNANGYKKCLDNDGNVAFVKGGSYANYYLAVYEADKVVKDSGSCVTFTDAPLATLDVTSGNSFIDLDTLRNIIALNAPYVVGNTYGVRFVVYGVGTNEGKIVHSKFDASVVSQLITLKFTEADLTFGQEVEEEKIVPIGLPNGWHLHGGDNNENNIDYPWEVATAKDEKVKEVNILIYDATYLLGDPATYDFEGATPLATYTIPAGGGWINWDTLGTAIREGWAELPLDNKLLSHKLVFAMQAVSNDPEYADSKLVYATDSEGNRAIEDFDMRMQIGINGVIDGGYNGNLYVAVGGNLPNFVTQFENQVKLIDSSIDITKDMAGANEYLEVIVRVYDHDDGSADKEPLFEYKSAFVDNFSANDLTSAWAAEYFKAHPDETTKAYNIDFAFAISVKDGTELKKYFIDSNEQLGSTSAQNVEITLTKPADNE